MSQTLNYNQIKLALNQYSNTIYADDPRFRRVVKLEHRDGTVMTFTGAFVVDIKLANPPDYEPEWLGIITEHHGAFLYDRSDLRRWEQLERFKGEVESITV